MPKNKMMNRFLERFQAILDELDEISGSEEMDEINAQFEDVLFLMESIDEEDEDAAEEMDGALEEIEDLLEQYRELNLPEVNQKAVELEMAVQMARNNL